RPVAVKGVVQSQGPGHRGRCPGVGIEAEEREIALVIKGPGAGDVSVDLVVAVEAEDAVIVEVARKGSGLGAVSDLEGAGRDVGAAAMGKVACEGEGAAAVVIKAAGAGEVAGEGDAVGAVEGHQIVESDVA